MPVYDYQCEKCGHRFDLYVTSIKEAVKCPKCFAGSKRLFTPTKSRPKFNGPGFHCNDYREK